MCSGPALGVALCALSAAVDDQVAMTIPAPRMSPEGSPQLGSGAGRRLTSVQVVDCLAACSRVVDAVICWCTRPAWCRGPLWVSVVRAAREPADACGDVDNGSGIPGEVMDPSVEWNTPTTRNESGSFVIEANWEEPPHRCQMIWQRSFDGGARITTCRPDVPPMLLTWGQVRDLVAYLSERPPIPGQQRRDQ
jgi:hypothetical protein